MIKSIKYHLINLKSFLRGLQGNWSVEPGIAVKFGGTSWGAVLSTI